MKKKYLLLTAVLCVSMMVFAGCGNRKNNEDANATGSPAAEESMTPEVTDDSSDGSSTDGEDALDEAGDAVRDAVDDTGDAVRDAVDDAGNAVDDAAKDAEDAMDGSDSGDDASDNNNSVTSGKKR